MLKTTLNLLRTQAKTSRYMRGMTRRFQSDKAMEAQRVLDEIYNTVRSQRFENIVVIQTKFNANPRYIILADAFNSRHLISGTEMINKHYKSVVKEPDQSFARLSIASEWNVVDFDSVIVHLFSKNCRQHYDIEQLWAVGEKYDDLTNFPENSYEQSDNQSLDSSSFLGSRIPNASS